MKEHKGKNCQGGWVIQTHKTNDGVELFQEKELPNLVLPVYLYISIIKTNMISKFALVMYVHIVSGFYQGSPAIWNKKSKQTQTKIKVHW